MTLTLKPAFYLPLCLLGILYCLNMRDHAAGWLLWTSFFMPPLFGLIILATILSAMKIVPSWLTPVWLILTSTFCLVLLGEGALALMETLNLGSKITMPSDWEIRRAPTRDAPDSFYWQGVLHEKDSNGFRKLLDHWPKKSERTRIMAIGDSFTYGLGVRLSDTYPAQLERLLGDRYEVLNVGLPGLNSTQVLRLLEKMTPELKPDLIIYGMCLNDFLDEREDPAKGNQPYAPPIPAWLRDPLITRTRLGAALDTGYNKLLLTLHLRSTVADDIMSSIETRTTRFERDVEGMNAWAKLNNLPPVIGMVLDNLPSKESQRLAHTAEGAMRKAGMQVVPTDNYYALYGGRALVVSPWEGHPSKEAHEIFAEMLVEAVKHHE